VWEDDKWEGIPLESMVMYEIHVGTFTAEGTFGDIVPRLRELKELGVNAIALMPVAQFPGARNWGYDGAYPYAVQDSYGGPDALKHLMNECHREGIAVVLDVVYNHLGPEGNYLSEFGPYFTERYQTPWGPAVNVDGPHSDEVRNFFIENALFWFREYHVDALRLDAIHAIHDMSAVPFLKMLAEQVYRFSQSDGRERYLIAESDLADATVLRPHDEWGYGFHAQWCDDLHHCTHTLLTGEQQGYYEDFGRPEDLMKCLQQGYVYTGQFSRYRMRAHGNSTAGRTPSQFIVCTQNHDQVGNRMRGERLSQLVSFEALKLAAGIVLLSPFVPLLFMGEEYADETPFNFFVSYSDPRLIEGVRDGRKEEFNAFAWVGEPVDPQSAETFHASKIRWDQRGEGKHGVLLRYYRKVIGLRKTLPPFQVMSWGACDVHLVEGNEILVMRRTADTREAVVVFNLNHEGVAWIVPSWSGVWTVELDSASSDWSGPGTSLPLPIKAGDHLNLRSHSITVFLRT
jgi:maltooligosyltrehalose trehalohydrolase